MTYEQFLDAKAVVISMYPAAICVIRDPDEWATITWYIYPDGGSKSILRILGRSQINEPDAWMDAADYIQNLFMYKLEEE
jgi:hypothetical protein